MSKKKKVCFCGEPVPASKGKRPMKYCRMHSEMPPHVRDKEKKKHLKSREEDLLSMLVDEKERNTAPATEETPVAEKAPATEKAESIELAEKQGPRDSKFCAWEQCGKEFFQGDAPNNAWANQKYCSPDCRINAENKRDRERSRRGNKKAAAKPSVFDQDLAVEIAKKTAEGIVEFLSPFLDGANGLDKYKAVAIKAGIECQKAAWEKEAAA